MLPEEGFDIVVEVGFLSEDLIADEDPKAIYVEMAHICLIAWERSHDPRIPLPEPDTFYLEELVSLLRRVEQSLKRDN